MGTASEPAAPVWKFRTTVSEQTGGTPGGPVLLMYVCIPGLQGQYSSSCSMNNPSDWAHHHPQLNSIQHNLCECQSLQMKSTN